MLIFQDEIIPMPGDRFGWAGAPEGGQTTVHHLICVAGDAGPEDSKDCPDCFFNFICHHSDFNESPFACSPFDRTDGQSVHFKETCRQTVVVNSDPETEITTFGDVTETKF